MSNHHDPGVKKITVQNWLEEDEAFQIWRQITGVAITQEQWAEFFLKPQLVPSVPNEIAKMLEVARAAMMHGCFYFPLTNLGMDQCFRLLETGVRLRCEADGIPLTFTDKNGKQRAKTFKSNIEALRAAGRISASQMQQWDAIRMLRNSGSHPKIRSICDPGEARNVLSIAVEILNDMFPAA